MKDVLFLRVKTEHPLIVNIMYFKPQTRRCMSCGHTFTYMQGDLIFELFPKYPKWGSMLTCKARFI